jgi:hypothetical protein
MQIGTLCMTLVLLAENQKTQIAKALDAALPFFRNLLVCCFPLCPMRC